MKNKDRETGNKTTGLEIAVIGMAGRFPAAGSIPEFWENLTKGVEAISFFSEQEYAQGRSEATCSTHPQYVKTLGGALENRDYFAASFFDYTPREAAVMDPQVRIFHECVWEALEDAGYCSDSYHGSIGLYAGASSGFNWECLSLLSGFTDELGNFAAQTLKDKDFLTTRISYKLDLQGPAFSLQTACSTGLAAIHLACRALLTGECKIALAGGVAVTPLVNWGYLFQEGLINSPDGHCRPFSARANGTVRGSGAGLVVLKPLKEAIADGDFIYAVIKGSAVNNDGVRKVGFTAPSVKGQAEVIRAALRFARVEPESIAYIEAHGTGTTLGDPVEIEALKRAFNTEKKGFCGIGSVKSNIGHLDAAAGAAGFIKAVLVLKHRQIPPTLHFDQPNTRIDFTDSPFYVVSRLTELKNDGYPMRAAVSSFGIGGGNVHVILEERPGGSSDAAQGAPTQGERPYRLILLSAESETALDESSRRMAHFLQQSPGINMADAAHTLQVGRRGFVHRRMLVCADAAEAAYALSNLSPGSVKTQRLSEANHPIIFMFPGQGHQYVEMGLGLYLSESLFREEMDRCFDILKSIIGYDLKTILYPGNKSAATFNKSFAEVKGGGLQKPPLVAEGMSDITQTEVAQPIIFVIEYALARLLMSWGIKPAAMIGHSIGEYVAAVLAQVFSLDDALKLVALRGRSMQQVPRGAMLSAPLAAEQLLPLLEAHAELSLAAVNGPSLCVVSGNFAAIDLFKKELADKGYETKRLQTSHAFHSKMMEPILQEFENRVGEVCLNAPILPYISNVTGTWITPGEALSPSYWANHIRKTVQFAGGLEQLLKKEKGIFVELGPGRVLGSYVKKHPARKDEQPVISLMRHGNEKADDSHYLLKALGELWLHGQAIDWPGFYSGIKRNRVPLPTYPFERRHFREVENSSRPLLEKLFRTPPDRQKKDMAQWYYVPSWKQHPLAPGSTAQQITGQPADKPIWLMFLDDKGIGARLLERSANAGQEAIRVSAGPAFTQVDDGSYSIDPTAPGDYDTLFEQLNKTGRLPDTIVHLWSITGIQNEGTTFPGFEKTQDRGFYSLLNIVQAAGRQFITKKMRLLVLSDLMQRVTGEEKLCPAKATLMGAVQVIPLEYSNISCRSIDIVLPQAGSPAEDELLEHLAAELKSISPDIIVAYRDNCRWIRTFVPGLPEKTQGISSRLKEKGVYLLTGGLGGIGLALAEYLVKSVRARLILTRRSFFPGREDWEKWVENHTPEDPVSRKILEIRELEKQEGEALVCRADAANLQEMQEVIRLAKERFGKIDGVFHCAGVADDAGIIQKRTGEMNERIMAPKTYGVLVLKQVLADEVLDFVILFSSLSAVLAPFGQVGYCAANNFLDAYSHSWHEMPPGGGSARQESVLVASINWDAWQEVGMAAAAGMLQNEAGITPAEGTAVLDHILHIAEPTPQVVVSCRDLNARFERYADQGFETGPGVGQFDRKSSLPEEPRQRLVSSPAFAQSPDETAQILCKVWQEHLGIERVELHDNFFDLGANSLDIVQVNNKLKKLFQKDIPLLTMYTYPTIDSLLGYFSREEGKTSLPGGGMMNRETAERKQNKATIFTRDGKAEIAVIGMAGRFPGARDIDTFWDNLQQGRETITFFSDEELAGIGVDPQAISAADYVKARGIIDDLEYFDAYFFGYKPREAAAMDPQIRVFMECVWEALEIAGYDPFSYDKAIGVYGGAADNVYWQGRVLSGTREFAELLCSNKDSLCTQISYKLNLRGPSFSVQTACSTSLTAVHLACRGLAAGECDMAVAGGVAIIFPERVGYKYQEGMLQSADGHCRTFDERAHGTVFGNGAGVVVLKPLEQAAADGDCIYAVIKGAAVNNDGERKVGYTAPSITGQADVIRAALRAAGVEAESIGYIEAHGTGTSVGDPIELEALKLGFDTDKKGFCRIGSVKSNIGHLDAAAGAAGFIKAVLILKHKQIPPSLHFEESNPEVDFANTPFCVADRLLEWRNDGRPLRAGVNSFGVGGTNVHVVLEEWPGASSNVEQGAAIPGDRPYRLILLSAESETALDESTRHMAFFLQQHTEINLADAAYTLQVGRRGCAYRRMLVCADAAEAVYALSNLSTGSVKTHYSREKKRPVIFMFPGQGSQYIDMGLGLYHTESIFREDMDRCFEILKPIIGYDLKTILYPGNKSFSGVKGPAARAATKLNKSFAGVKGGLLQKPPLVAEGNDINQTGIAQPILFVIEYALARLLMSWGIKPAAMIGHSIGEYVAAVLARVFSLEDALKLVALRGRLMQQTPRGAMLSVPLSQEQLLPLLETHIELSLAAVNGPAHCVVSGNFEAIDLFAKESADNGYETKRVQTSHAFHSKMMESILQEFESRVGEVRLNAPILPYISNVSGTWITPGEALSPAYWANHIRKTVQFADGIGQLLKKEKGIFVEIGPGRVLGSYVRKHPARKDEQPVISLMRHSNEKADDSYYLLKGLGELWLNGQAIDWPGFYSGVKRNRVPLPTYPFARRRCWSDEQGKESKPGEQKPSQHTDKKKKKDIADWFYIPSWKRSILPVNPGHESVSRSPAQWLIFLDNCGYGRQLVKKLSPGDGSQDITAMTVSAGPGFDKGADGEYVIEPGRAADYDALFAELLRLDRMPNRIVHLWGITAENRAAGDRENQEPGWIDRFEKAQDFGFYSLLYTAQAIGKLDFNFREEIRLVVISNNMQEVTGEEKTFYPEKNPVLGVLKVIPQEYPNIRCVGIDIDDTDKIDLKKEKAGDDERLIDRLISEILAGIPEPVVAYRGGHRWVQYFEAVKLEKDAKSTPVFKERGVYLVTGGLGRIGLILAEHLARTFSARLVLTGRSVFPEPDEWQEWLQTHDKETDISRKIEKLGRFLDYGAEVLVLTADVASEADMREVFSRAEERFGTIDGVIHAAGVMNEKNFAAVRNTGKQLCEQQFRAKAYGAMALEKASAGRGQESGFCLLMSSLSALLGGLGFAAYAAGNIFMDSFVQHHNRTAAFPWISVNWDSWETQRQETSSAVGKEVVEMSMTPAEGVEALQRILSRQAGEQVVVSTGDLHDRLNKWIRFEFAAGEKVVTEEEALPLQERPELPTPFVQPRNRLEQTIMETWQKFLGLDRLGIHDNFFDLGANSLDIIQVNKKLKEILERNIPLEVMFEYPTIAALTEYLNAAGGKEEETQPADSQNRSVERLEKTFRRLRVEREQQSTDDE